MMYLIRISRCRKNRRTRDSYEKSVRQLLQSCDMPLIKLEANR